MKNKSQTIRRIVGFLNRADEDGGFWLPNIQRPFVWKEDQICRLFDSILREYGSDTIHLLFNLWYREFKYDPAYDNNLPQVDHIFPQVELKLIRERSPESGRLVMKYKERERNQLANCMLLTREENGPSGKGATVPEEWFKGKDSAYLQMHLIPDEPQLWKLDRFEEFIVARKELIKQKFRGLLV